MVMKKLVVLVFVLAIVVSAAYAGGNRESSAAPSAPAPSAVTPAAAPITADYFQSGMAALNARNYDQAIADFEQAVSLDQNITMAYLGIAYSYDLKGDEEGGDTIEALIGAINSMPSVIEAFDQRIYVDFRDEFYLIIADFESRLEINTNGVDDFALHLAMQSGAFRLMMNEPEE